MSLSLDLQLYMIPLYIYQKFLDIAMFNMTITCVFQSTTSFASVIQIISSLEMIESINETQLKIYILTNYINVIFPFYNMEKKLNR